MAWPISQFERSSVQLGGMLDSVAARKPALAGATSQKKTTGNAINKANSAPRVNHRPRVRLRITNASNAVEIIADGSRIPPTFGGLQWTYSDFWMVMYIAASYAILAGCSRT